MPNVMAALPNIGGALCSTPQSLADAQYWNAVQYRCQDVKPVEIYRGVQTNETISAASKLWDGAQMAIFGDFFGSCICSEPRAAGFRHAF